MLHTRRDSVVRAAGRGLFAVLAAACGSTPAPVSPAPTSPSEPTVAAVDPPSAARSSEESAPSAEPGDPSGVEGSVEGGLYGAVSAPPPPPPPPPPRIVQAPALEALRIAGSKTILPDEATKPALVRTGKDRVAGSYKLCITRNGDVASVSQLKSTGVVDYDAKIQNTIRGQWRYRPYAKDGAPEPVCAAVTVVYRPAVR